MNHMYISNLHHVPACEKCSYLCDNVVLNAQTKTLRIYLWGKRPKNITRGKILKYKAAVPELGVKFLQQNDAGANTL